MKVIVTFSGGKDSLASLLWVRDHISEDFITVFCDTGWEHPLTYEYIDRIKERLNLNLVVLKSRTFDGMADLVTKKKMFPAAKRRLCTSELKVKPMIDYILDEVSDHILVIQGIRAEESRSRAAMENRCTYFKNYFQPYGFDSRGKPKYETYRKRDVRRFREQFADDLLRPVFDWTARQVVDYIRDHGVEINPLYKMGFKRVGCYPCIMSSQQDIYNICTQDAPRIAEIAELERTLGASFFRPGKIPERFYEGKSPSIDEVVQYVKDKQGQGKLNDDYAQTSCMSYYGLCE